jgi:hypothetical protein
MATSSALLKTLLHKTIAEGLYKEVTSRTSKYYYFLGKTLSWADETAPPYPVDSFQYEKDTRNEMITIKQIKPSDVGFVVDRVEWTSGQVYDIYDDQYSTEVQGLNITNGGGGYTSIPILIISSPDLPGGVQATAEATLYNGEIIDTTMTNRGSGYTNTPTVIVSGGGLGEGAVIAGTITKAPSNAQKLEDARTYVMTNEYNVYKCLDNNNNSRSTVRPIGTQILPISLSDGYVWKYLYNVPIALRTKFLTDSYMPVVTALTQQFYSSGGIESVTIENIGKDYTSANIIVAGDGYLESNPVFLTTVNIGNGGHDYVDGDTLTVAQPIQTVRDWASEIGLYLGQRIRHLNNIYQVERAGISSTVGPTHRSGTSTNGTGALKYLGTTAKAYPTFTSDAITGVNLLGGVREVNLNSHGSGYNSNPTVTFSYPKVYFDQSMMIPGSYDFILGPHWYESGDQIVYDAEINTSGHIEIDGLVSGETYYVIKRSSTMIQLALTYEDAIDGIPVTWSVNSGDQPNSFYSDRTLASGFAELSPTGVVKRIKIIDSGENYPSAPTVTIGNPWVKNTAVVYGEQYFTGGRLYTVTAGGTTDELGDAPSGIVLGTSELNGSATFVYVGTAAAGNAVLQFGAGYDTNPRITVNTATGAGFSASFTSSKSEAKLIPIVDTNGQITQVQIDDPGVGYSAVDLTVTGDGIDATISADISIGNINTLQANNELLTVDGTINNIQIISQGYAYGVAPIVIHGDGSGAMAEAIISGGKIVQIKVTNQGVGYTYATVEIQGNGFAAKARAIISPYGGHGKDAYEELFARTLMFYSNVSRDKNQGFDVNNDYRQIGILKNPRGFNQTTRYASNLGSACYAVGGSINLNIFEKDMLLTCPRLINAVSVQVRYRIVSLNSTGALLQDLDNSPPQIADLLTNGSNQYFAVTAVSPPTVDKYSGDLLFIDNKAGFTPSADETVTLRTVIKF